MFRLISLLVVIAALGLMGALAVDSLGGTDCDAPGRTTTSLPIAVPKGVERIVNDCT